MFFLLDASSYDFDKTDNLKVFNDFAVNEGNSLFPYFYLYWAYLRGKRQKPVELSLYFMRILIKETLNGWE
jgi:hypothetical protein